MRLRGELGGPTRGREGNTPCERNVESRRARQGRNCALDTGIVRGAWWRLDALHALLALALTYSGELLFVPSQWIGSALGDLVTP